MSNRYEDWAINPTNDDIFFDSSNDIAGNIIKDINIKDRIAMLKKDIYHIIKSNEVPFLSKDTDNEKIAFVKSLTRDDLRIKDYTITIENNVFDIKNVEVF